MSEPLMRLRFVSILSVALGLAAMQLAYGEDAAPAAPSASVPAPASAGATPTPAPAPAPAVVKWNPIVTMDNQLYPSYILATATLTEKAMDLLLPAVPPNLLGDRNGQLGVEVETVKPGSLVRVEIRSTRFVKLSSQEVKVEKPGTYRFFPTLEWSYDDLRMTREVTPETVTFTVLVDGDEIGSKKQRVTVRSLNDCPFGRKLGEGETLETKNGEAAVGMPWMFAAYVNEGDPAVDLILKEALATGIIPAFVGYQASPESVVREVFAIWTALRERGIKYSNTPIAAGFSQNMLSQNVRLMGDSLNYKQSNCVDGSALILGVLRKLGIDGSLMLVPGHCLIAVSLKPDRKYKLGSVESYNELREVIFIETTSIGSPPKEKAFIAGLKLLGGNAPRGVPKKYAESYKNFVGAIAEGYDNGRETLLTSFGADLARDNISFVLIPIDDARKQGIQPVSYLRDNAAGNSGEK